MQRLRDRLAYLDITENDAWDRRAADVAGQRGEILAKNHLGEEPML